MPIWKMPISIESCLKDSKGTMLEHLGIEFTKVGDDFLCAKMPVDHRTIQPLGIMHGGASCVLAESVGSIAANYAVNQKTSFCVGLDINTNHVRSIREGYVYAKATPFHLGRTTQVWHIEIKNEEDKLISVNRLTLAVMNR